MGKGGLSSKLQNPYHANLRELDPLIVLYALIDFMVVENREHGKASLNGLEIFSKMIILFFICKHIVVLNLRGVETLDTPRSINMQFECIKSNFITTISVLLVVVDVLDLEQCKQILDYANIGHKTHLNHHIQCCSCCVDLLDLKHVKHITLPSLLELGI